MIILHKYCFVVRIIFVGMHDIVGQGMAVIIDVFIGMRVYDSQLFKEELFDGTVN